MLCILDLLKDLANRAILTLLDRCNVIHHVLEQVLDEDARLFVTVHPLVDLYLNHFAQLVRYLSLTTLEAVDLEADRIIDFGNLSAKSDLLLGTGHLFLADPAIDTAKLCIKVRVHGLDGLILSLELRANIAVHLVVALTHLLDTLSALFTLHSLLQVHLVSHVVDLSRALLLLRQQTIDKICDFHFKPVRVVVRHLVHHVPELIVVFQAVHLDTTEVLLLFLLLHVH